MDMLDDEEYDERDQIVESKEDDLQSEKAKTHERDQIENPQSLKIIDSQKTERMIILLILKLSWRQMW